MKYGKAQWIVKPGDRKSLSFYVPEVVDYINDNYYKGSSIFDGSCTEYFFTKPSDLIISEEYLNGLKVDYMTKDNAIEFLRNNTIFEEIELGKFIVTKEEIDGDVIKPAIYLTIN